MSSDSVTIKVEPPDDFSLENKSASPGFMQNGESETGSDRSVSAGTSSHDYRNFTCLLCEVICENRDELRRHLKTYHASKHGTFNSYVNNLISPEAAIAGLSSYMTYRYTCSLCGAKFRTLRSYMSHNMSHRSLTNTRAMFEDSGMASLGKQYLQEYFESDDGYSGTFSCSECNTVFTQRDAYAMHMMMRAMNETCQHVPLVSPAKSEKTEPEDDTSAEHSGDDVMLSPPDPVLKHDIPVNVQQKCLEDVTSSVDQDEYLKSVLDKVLTSEEPKPKGRGASPRRYNENRKLCKFCGGNFLDQDALAMHVMSDHSEEMALPSNRKEFRSAKYLKYSNWLSQSEPGVLNYNCKHCGETFLSRDCLAMHVLSHAHQGGKKSEFLGNNLLKRPRELDHDPLTTESQRAKILRRVGQYNHLSFRQRKGTDLNAQAEKTERESLYCGKCNITFYIQSEFEWHTRNYHETAAADDEQPLCLTKHTTVHKHETLTNDKENNIVKDVAINHVIKSPKQRRNSFSNGKSSRNHDTGPKRPLSADDCANLKSESSNPSRGHTKSPATASTNTTSKSPNSGILPNLNALSSNEQRIIVSVFGKNLNLNGVKGYDTESESDESISVKEESHDEFDNNVETPLPTDLTISKSPITSTSGETVSSESYSATGNASDVIVANEQDGRHRLLNSDMRDAPMCKYCDIVFFNKAIYYLHMGLHNVNNPWQCNVCGKCCTDAVDFAAHVIHM